MIWYTIKKNEKSILSFESFGNYVWHYGLVLSKKKNIEGIGIVLTCKSIHNGECYPILFYHIKKLIYQLYHTILQYTQHSKTLSFFFPFYLNILFYSYAS